MPQIYFNSIRAIGPVLMMENVVKGKRNIFLLAIVMTITLLLAGQVSADYDVTISGNAGANGSWTGTSPDVWTPNGTGSNVAAADIRTRLDAGTGVTISTSGGGAGNGDIFVNYAISWSADAALTLSAYRNVNVNSNVTATGNTAGLTLTPSNTGAGGSYYLNDGAVITLSGSNPGLTIAGNAYTVINDVTALQNMSSGLSGYYALGSNIDASATSGWNAGAGFAPVGNNTAKFTGTFDGLGHTITGLTINRPAADYIGLFGYADGATIRNVGLENGSVTGNACVGGLVGYNAGAITNSYNTGAVSGSGDCVGGLVGQNYSAITNSYSTGAVSGRSYVGGLVGENFSAITNSYSTGAADGSGDCIGGLVGQNPGAITNSYSTGRVSYGWLGWFVGGLTGTGSNGTATNSYWDTQTSGLATSGGGTGLTTAQMKQQASFNGWDFTNIWWIDEGVSYPTLRVFLVHNTLNIIKAGTGGGTVISSPASIDCGGTCAADFAESTVVTLTATADSGSTFSGWSGDADCSDGSVTMDADKSCTATFTLNTYTLTVNKTGTGAGTVNATGCILNWVGDTGTCTVDVGTVITLSGDADTGSTFGGWSNGTGSAASCSDTGDCLFNITQDSSVTAAFTLNQYTVTADANGTGFGNVSSDTGGINFDYQANNTGTSNPIDHGTNVVLTAAAAAGSTASWNDCVTAGGVAANNGTQTATCTFNSLNGNKTATATFTPGPDLVGRWTSLTSDVTGTYVQGELKVRNAGNENAGAFRVSLYLSRDGVTPRKLIRTYSIQGLNAGSTRVLSFQHFSGRSMSGRYIVAVIDSAAQVAETDEDNNRAARRIP